MDQCTCKDIDLSQWNLVELDWSGKSFYQVGLAVVFQIPVNIPSKIKQLFTEIEAKGYHPLEPIKIVSRNGTFQGNIMVEIERPDKPDPGVVTFDEAKLIAQGVQGPYSRLSKAVKEIKRHVARQYQTRLKEVYFWYIFCPECAKDPGIKTIVLGRYI